MSQQLLESVSDAIHGVSTCLTVISGEHSFSASLIIKSLVFVT